MLWIRKKWLLYFALLGSLQALLARNADVRQEIEHLIQSVAISGAIFIRNGAEHSAADAASHLRLKWQRAGGRIKTAEQFIAYLASKSSTSGQPYRMRLTSGRTMLAADWMHAELAKYRQKQGPE